MGAWGGHLDPVKAWSRRMAMALALLGVTRGAFGQSAPSARPATWTFTLDIGGFLVGNRNAVTTWLRDNAYGVSEPEHCGFDIILRPKCNAAVDYPQVSASGIVAAMASVRRRMTDRLSLELFAATEQAGVATGRCDDIAVPKDPRCTNRFIVLDFGGGSVGMLAAIKAGYLRLGAGPALMLANWRMHPAHLSGLWLDATVEREPLPIFARAQYRIYRSTSLSPGEGFTGFHPSTLFAGLGFTTRANNSGR